MDNNFEYDVFISCAVEDKIGLVNEVIHKLNESGINVCPSSHKLSIDKKIGKTIQEGLKKSSHGIMVISHNFFAKEWPKKELHRIWDQKKRPHRILPIWYNITEEQIRKYDPILAKTTGFESRKGIDHVLQEIISHLKKENQKNCQLTSTQSSFRTRFVSYFLNLFSMRI